MKIAIIGAQCRFPDESTSPDGFIDNLSRGLNHAREVPADRWNPARHYHPGRPDKAYVKNACWLDYDYKSFDALAFGFAPKEVEFIDPQQRLLLTTTWEALENAGLDIDALSGAPVGVYIGGFTTDHLINQFSSHARGAIGAHSAAGATLTMLANRISYAFDFTGPSLSIDTACSSSLVAFAIAAQDIAAGRCDMAIAGGVNFMLRPEYVIAMCKGRFLAPDGRSKSFDAAADGYGRGEGCGIVILKEARRAIEDHDEIIAFVDGVGINQDGRTGGITVPNQQSQQSLMHRVVHANGIDPASVLYVEAHGTGTPIGDPTEAGAIGAVYGQIERAAPCVIGSVKSNIGHLEAAAGVAALIKAAWMLKRNVIPPLATLQTPNPNIPFERLNLALATRLSPLGDPAATRRVAINSFGYGGTNAHVILSSAHAEAERPATASGGHAPSLLLAPVSARTPASLAGCAARLAATLESGLDVPDVLHGIVRRAHFEHRAAVWGEDRAALSGALDRIGRGERPENCVTAQALFPGKPKTAFVYTGMGPQWWAMGRGLWNNFPVYREALEEADRIFERIAGFSIVAEMLKSESESRIKQTEIAQPANFLLQLGLTRLLEAEGLVPEAVVGHSVGEVASAWASGMLPLEQALLVSRHRSRLQARAAGQGAMLAASIDESMAHALVDNYQGAVDIAAINAPASVTLAGEAAALAEIERTLTAQGRFAKLLDVEVPYHSQFMEPLRDELIASLSKLKPQTPDVPLYSTVTAGPVEALRYDGAYWADNVRKPVLFMAAIRRLIDDGYTHFVEVGPHPVLSRSILDTIAASGAEARHVPTLSMKLDDGAALGKALASHYTAGGRIDWKKRHPAGRRVPLPNYAWNTHLLWHEAPVQEMDRLAFGPRALAQGRTPTGEHVIDLNVQRLAFLDDHRVSGVAVLPAAAYLEILFAVAEADLGGETGWALHEIQIERGLVLTPDKTQHLSVSHDREQRRARVISYNELDVEQGVLHIEAELRPSSVAPAPRADFARVRENFCIEQDVEAAYRHFAGLGLEYLPAFRPIVELYHRPDRQGALARLALPAGLQAEAAHFLAHPVLVDGAFQTALSLVGPEDGAYLPTSINEFRLMAPLPDALWVRIEIVRKTPWQLSCDLELMDADGQRLASISGLQCSALNPPEERPELPGGDYAYAWDSAPFESSRTSCRLFFVHDRGDAFAEELIAAAGRASESTEAGTWDDPHLLEAVSAACHAEDMPPLRLVLVPSSGLDARRDPIAEQTAIELLKISKYLASMRGRKPRLWLVTRNAMPPGPVIPAQSALLGLMRTVYSELDDLEFSVCDFDQGASGSDAVLAELLADTPGRGEETRLRGTERMVPVLRSTGLFKTQDMESVRLGDVCLRFDRQAPLQIDTPVPGSGEVRIDFDALCLLPKGETDDPRVMGFSGRVRALGEGIDPALLDWPLCGLAPETLQSRAVFRLEELSFIERPAHLTPEAACALGPVQSPVDALLASLSSPDVRRALVTDSPLGNALAFRLAAKGVAVTTIPADPEQWRDVPLEGRYSLIAAPLAAFARVFGLSRWLAQGGKLVELAQGNTEPFLLPEQTASMHRIDARSISAPTAEALRLSASKESAAPRALALADWPGLSADIQILSLDAAACVSARKNRALHLRRDGVYLITGGLGALGRETAKWLARRGAGHIVLCGRKGMETPGAREAVDTLAALGAQARILALDITDAQAVAAAVDAMDTPATPLCGVFHAAGVLADKFAVDLEPEDLVSVMRPKALGALALHEATRGRPLDLFVLFSSIASVVGNKRQSNYCAANAWLDGLAHARHHQGLPALSINLGAVGEVGMASVQAVEAHLRQIGLMPMPLDQMFAGIEAALASGAAQAMVSAMPDWERFVNYDPRGARTPRMLEIATPFLERKDGGRLEAIKETLSGAPPVQRVEALTALLSELVAAELKMEPEAVSPKRPLEELGVDSLIATGVQTAIESSIGVQVSSMLLIGGNTIQGLAEHILNRMGFGGERETCAMKTTT